MQAIIIVNGSVVSSAPFKSCLINSTFSFCPLSRTLPSISAASKEISIRFLISSISSPSYLSVSGKSNEGVPSTSIIMILLVPISSPVRRAIPASERYPTTYSPGSGGKRLPSGVIRTCKGW